MKKNMLPRSCYEAYFVPAGGKKSRRRTIADYLRGNHPFFSAESCYSCSPCSISGQRYFLVIVPETGMGLKEFRRSLTQTALLSSSEIASAPCIIRCPGELLRFGPEPVSLSVSDDAPIPVRPDRIFGSQDEIREYSILRHVKCVTTYRSARSGLSRGAFRFSAACFALLGSTAIAGAALLARPQELPADIHARAPVEAALPEPPGPFGCLSLVALTATESGCHIASYRYRGGAASSLSMTIEGGRPMAFVKALKGSGIAVDVSVPSISYDSGKARFEAFVSLMPGGKPAERLERIENIERIEKFFRDRGFTPSKVILEPLLQFSFNCPPSSIALFVRTLEKCTDSHNAGIGDWIISGNGGSGTGAGSTSRMSITVSLHESACANASDTLSSDQILADAFDVQLKPPALNEKEPGSIVGKITEQGMSTMVFRQTSGGKLLVSGGSR